MEYVQGQTLAQWMIDHPRPELSVVRDIVDQIARGLQAFHRMEMLHQDLRPENIMIDTSGTVKIIDFGSVHVAGLAENAVPVADDGVPGTLQYAAPEYFLGEPGTPQSDLFSLGVITYQMLTGRQPYGTQVAGIRTRAALMKLHYASALDEHRAIPAWMDAVLRRAVHPNPLKRQEALSEFVHDLRQPSAAYLGRARPALYERNPMVFWRAVADARRVPQMDGFVAGAVTRLEEAQGGPLTTLPELPTGADVRAPPPSPAPCWTATCPCRPPSHGRWNTSCVWPCRSNLQGQHRETTPISPDLPRPLRSRRPPAARPLHPGGRGAGRPRAAHAQGAARHPGRQRAAGGRPGQPRRAGARPPHGPRGPRRQARRLQEHAPGFIERLMQMAVLEGENVVRLKGGDPMVFGRGGEEVAHLRAAGIAVEVVNGVTAGIACSAALGTALTHREQAHGVLFITGHAHPGRETDWALIAGTAHAARLTLVIYMGVSRLADIEQGLLAGLPAHTPAAIVERVSLPEQRVARCTLATLHSTARSKGLASPCIIASSSAPVPPACSVQARPASAG
jgi:siroheme synthase